MRLKIIDTTQSFFQLRQKADSFDMCSLEQYYGQYPEVFDEYFQYHCPRTEERLTSALERYPQQLHDMQQVVDRLPNIIREVMNT
jgi:hypothetical protein